MREYCVCAGEQIYLQMRNLAGQEVVSFPVTVYDVNETPLGVATNKEEYITIWNASPVNSAIGRLSGLIGPFSFNLFLRPGATEPNWVIGESEGSVGFRVFVSAFVLPFGNPGNSAGSFSQQFSNQFN